MIFWKRNWNQNGLLGSFFESYLASFGFALLVMIILGGLLAPILSPQNPYDLTTIKQPITQMVDSTVNILLHQINYPEGKKSKIIKVDPSLVIRNSTIAVKEAK